MNLHTDERGLVVGWGAKLVFFIALLGVLIYDASAIAVNVFQLDSISDEIALTVSSSAGDQPLFALEREAKKLARSHGARLVKLTLSDDEEFFRVTLRREAKTLVVSRVDRLSDWGQTSATGKSRNV
ncbi:MAG: hypothetical protein ACRDK3_06755 [Actinomycetota bacterium]